LWGVSRGIVRVTFGGVNPTQEKGRLERKNEKNQALQTPKKGNEKRKRGVWGGKKKTGLLYFTFWRDKIQELSVGWTNNVKP